MKRLFILIALVLLPVLSCAQDRFESPQNVEWDGESSAYEIAVQSGISEIITLGITTDKEYTIDLQEFGLYGVYAILVRAVEYTNPDLVDYSDWIRSDNELDVITIDGEYQTFLIINKKQAVKPSMIRIK